MNRQVKRGQITKNTIGHVKITGFNIAFDLRAGHAVMGQVLREPRLLVQGIEQFCPAQCFSITTARQTWAQVLPLPSDGSPHCNHMSFSPLSVLHPHCYFCASAHRPQGYSLSTLPKPHLLPLHWLISILCLRFHVTSSRINLHTKKSLDSNKYLCIWSLYF